MAQTKRTRGRIGPSANDGALEVLVASEPHEEHSLGALGRFLLRHRRIVLVSLVVGSAILVLFAWTLANGEEINARAFAIADGDRILSILPGGSVRFSEETLKKDGL